MDATTQLFIYTCMKWLTIGDFTLNLCMHFTQSTIKQIVYYIYKSKYTNGQIISKIFWRAFSNFFNVCKQISVH